jgi:very-short-patch-repair endonuclease
MTILVDIRGRQKKVSISKYFVEWDKIVGSNAQFSTKQFLRKYWLGETVCEEFRIPGSRLRIDLINFSRKVVVEVSGRQHENFNKFFHKNRIGFIKSIKRDFEKIHWIETNGFSLIEIYDYEVENLNTDFIKEKFGIDL